MNTLPAAHDDVPEPDPADGAGIAELFDDEFIPTLRRLGERARGATGPLGEDDAAARAAVWDGLTGLGALRLGMPRTGGADIVAGPAPRLVPVLPIVELMGRALYQSPYFDTLAAADLIALTELTPDGELFDRIARGDVTIAVAGRDDGRADPRKPGPIDADARTGKISGTRRFVGFVADVDLLLVIGCTGAETTAHLVPADQAGVTAHRQDDIGRGELYTVQFDRANCVPCPTASPGVMAAWDRALPRARLRLAGYLTGLCLGALDLGTAYARRRRVFGQPLGRFQGPAFRLAGLAARIEAVRTLVHRTCTTADTGADVALPACQALLLAGELAQETAAEVVQIHGSYGLTDSCDAQLFYRRAIIDGVLLGTGRDLRRQAAELLTERHAPTT